VTVRALEMARRIPKDGSGEDDGRSRLDVDDVGMRGMAEWVTRIVNHVDRGGSSGWREIRRRVNWVGRRVVERNLSLRIRRRRTACSAFSWLLHLHVTL